MSVKKIKMENMTTYGDGIVRISTCRDVTSELAICSLFKSAFFRLWNHI